MTKEKGGKTLLLLGGLPTLRPVIETARSVGCRIVTADWLPGNPAHSLSDEYVDASVTDTLAVERAARKVKADGILSFAVDPGVVSASVVAARLGLPFQGSAGAVAILQDKTLFRKFLADNGFNVPKCVTSRILDDDGKVNDAGLRKILADASVWRKTGVWPVIVKPADNAGSKGIRRVDVLTELREAIVNAAMSSRNGKIIMEQFIESSGHPSDSDCFSVGGRMVSVSYSDQYFDPSAANPYVPSAYSWPSTMPPETQRELRESMQRLCDLLGLGDGIYNVETRLGKDGRAYIMEFSPRGGGNRNAEMLDLFGGTHMIDNTVRAAIGMPLLEAGDPLFCSYPSLVVLHADREGIFSRLQIDEALKPYVVEIELRVKPGEKIYPFTGANRAVGTLILNFDTRQRQRRMIERIAEMVKVVTDI